MAADLRNRSDVVSRFSLPVATLVFFGVTATGYGVFRDELYYIACGRHLDWGYVDHPPLVALIARIAGAAFGSSWIVLRLISAVAAAGTVLLVGDTASELGGGRWARLLAQVLTIAAPVYLSLFSIYSMNAFDVLIWAGLVRIAARLLADGDPKLWLAFGCVAGIGLENKLDVAMLGAGLVLGLMLARRVDVLRRRWIWFGGAVAAALFAPHVLWQIAHDWPTREFVANAQREKITALGPLGFVAKQFVQAGPFGFTLAMAGLVWLLVDRSSRAFRPLGWAALFVLLVLAASISKPYYFAPALTIVFPAAGVALEEWIVGGKTLWLRAVALLAAASSLVACAARQAARFRGPLRTVRRRSRRSARHRREPSDGPALAILRRHARLA
jgi:4-amino-4-deoxy-L-arabinose transferase-like glycosyltransferase